MTVRALVLDLDGTLLNTKSEINPKTKAALIQLQQEGLHVILASGRPTPSVLAIAQELELDKYNGHIITFNGAHVMNYATKETLFEQPLNIESSKEILSHLDTFNVAPMICIDDMMYVEDVYAGIIDFRGGKYNVIEHEARSGAYKICEVDSLTEFVHRPLYKILVTGEVADLDRHLAAIKAPFHHKYTINKSADFFIELTDFNVDKARALQHVLDVFNVTQDEVMAVGDGMNDVTLLEFAKIGVVMGNAPDAVKAYADYVTDTNDNDGIVKALHHFNILK